MHTENSYTFIYVSVSVFVCEYIFKYMHREKNPPVRSFVLVCTHTYMHIHTHRVINLFIYIIFFIPFEYLKKCASCFHS